LKKSKFVFSKRSESNLEGVNPDLSKIARRALELSEIDFCVTEGLRTRERQQKMLAEGKSQTLNSRHLTGDAIDVAAIVAGTVNWDWEFYEQIARAFKQAARELEIQIEWGGDWKTLRDGVHFQLQRGAA